MNRIYPTCISPNPATNVFYITSNFEIHAITIINYSEQVVMRSGISEKSATISIGGFESGIYLVRIDTEEGEYPGY